MSFFDRLRLGFGFDWRPEYYITVLPLLILIFIILMAIRHSILVLPEDGI